jgi:hypothetical protein
VAIEGNLNTMSLASLIQAICLEQRKAALFLKRDADEGVIYFDGGEITHATLGPLLGEDAVFELVTWTEGTFHIGNYDVLPRRTIVSDWNFLLMEGMRRMDEGQAKASADTLAEKSLSSAEIEHDRSLEIDLITLLSKLEHSRARLTEQEVNQGPNLKSHLLKGMATSVLQFAKSLPVLPERHETYRTALAKMAESFRSNPLFSGNPMTVDEIGENVTMLLERFFSIFGAQFASPAVADRWIEASAVFLKDLSKSYMSTQHTSEQKKG